MGSVPTASPEPGPLRRRRTMVPRLPSGDGEEAGEGGDWTADEEVVVVEQQEPLLPPRRPSGAGKASGLVSSPDTPPEPLWTVAVQVFVPFLIAGFGTVGAGLVLDVIQVSPSLSQSTVGWETECGKCTSEWSASGQEAADLNAKFNLLRRKLYRKHQKSNASVLISESRKDSETFMNCAKCLHTH